MTYTLHYAPDNASLIIRMALDHHGLAYRTQLVDRAAKAQTHAPYRALNPLGLIPTLETPDGPLFETGAILLWLADTHDGLGPAPDAPTRGDFLKWLFFVSNTLHPALRMIFYPEKYIAPDQVETLRKGLQNHLHAQLTTFDALAASRPPYLGAANPTVLDFYTVALLRWAALYPSTRRSTWFDLMDFPALARICTQIEALPCTATLQKAEGLGMTPFTAPQTPTPPEGSAL